MQHDYEFEVTITAVVRVRAESENLAREVSLPLLLHPLALKKSGWPIKPTS